MRRFFIALVAIVTALGVVLGMRMGQSERDARARLGEKLTPPPRVLGIAAGGSRLLLQGETPSGFSLTVIDTATKENIATIALDKRPRQPVWSPNGERIAYGIEQGRAESELRIWDLGSRRELRPNVPRTRIVTSPRWAPDGKRLAFVVEHGDVRRLYVVDAVDGGAAEEIATITSKAGIAWSKDGSSIVTVRKDDPSAIALRQRDASWQRVLAGEGIELRELSWSGGRLLATARARDDKTFGLLEIDLQADLTRRLPRPPLDGDITSPGRMSNGDVYVVVHEAKSQTQSLFVCDPDGASCRNVGPSPIKILRHGSTPTSLFARVSTSIVEVDVATGATKSIYEPPQAGVAGERIDVPSYDGLSLPLLVRRTTVRPSRGAVLHVLAGEHESPPPWDARTDFLHDSGIDVVNVYVRGKHGFGRALEQAKGDSARDVLAARDWIESTLGIRNERIVLLGQSAGSLVAARAARAMTTSPAALVLVSIPSTSSQETSPADDRPGRCAFAFHGRDDETPPEVARASLERLLGRGTTTPPCGSFNLLDGEAHEIERSASWVPIYQTMLKALPAR